MILWTDWLAVVLVTAVSVVLLHLIGRRLQVLQMLYRFAQNPIHYRQAQMLRRFQLALKILLPTVWILILIATGL